MRHVVVQGEHLPAIAERYGFASCEPLWSHPDNADLRRRRRVAEILAPGDEVTIPERQEKSVPGATARKHRFVLLGEPLELRLRVRNLDGNPVAGASCQVSVGSDAAELTTDDDGGVQTSIPRTELCGTLTLGDETFDIAIGALDPIDTDTGWQSRLVNLGYLAPPVRTPSEEGADLDDDDQRELRAALEELQCDHDLPQTGAMDPGTRAKLLEIHGC